MNSAALVIHQTRFDLRGFMRDRRARFFTLVLPVIFLVIFVGVFGNDPVRSGGERVSSATYFVPGIVALGIVSASFANLVMAITAQRELGVLKRRRATPVPAWVIIAGRTLAAVLTSLLVVVVLLAIGTAAYGVALPSTTIPGVLATVVLGSVALCGVGYAVSTAITSVDSAQPVVQALVLPLYFISGVFVPASSLPLGLRDLANVFPIAHLADGLRHAFDPLTTGSGIVARDIGVLLAWAVAGLLIALWRFSWVPRGSA